MTEHPFTPFGDEPWGRCQICGLAAPAHEQVPEPYEPTASYRCADCVMRGRPTCVHHAPHAPRHARRGEP